MKRKGPGGRPRLLESLAKETAADAKQRKLVFGFGLSAPASTGTPQRAATEAVDLSKTAPSAFSSTSSSGHQLDSYSDVGSSASCRITAPASISVECERIKEHYEAKMNTLIFREMQDVLNS